MVLTLPKALPRHSGTLPLPQEQLNQQYPTQTQDPLTRQPSPQIQDGQPSTWSKASQSQMPNVYCLQLVPSEGTAWTDSQVHDLSPRGDKASHTWVLPPTSHNPWTTGTNAEARTMVWHLLLSFS